MRPPAVEMWFPGQCSLWPAWLALSTSDFTSERGFVPHIRPRSRVMHRESWSEWQDLNLRPPRPERGAQPLLIVLRIRAEANRGEYSALAGPDCLGRKFWSHVTPSVTPECF
jgi:hypothetical protein